jgi:hypothetical protein
VRRRKLCAAVRPIRPRRDTALALFAFTGYTAAFIGPVAAGIALDEFGGDGNSTGWIAAGGRDDRRSAPG